MAATAPSVELSASQAPIPVCTPHLMPFHIKYTGPAPISTYFRPQAAPEPTFGENTPQLDATQEVATSVISPTASESQTTLVADSQSSEAETPPLTRNTTSTTLVDVDMGSPEQEESSLSSGLHLTAAFRGRTVRGITVDLPQGYAGVVLSSSDKPVEVKSKPKPKRAPAGKRGSRRAPAVEEAEDVEEDLLVEEVPSGPVRTLEATGTFSSFVLWNADNPVDRSRDEYLRTLTEWTKLAEEIHRYDD